MCAAEFQPPHTSISHASCASRLRNFVAATVVIMHEKMVRNEDDMDELLPVRTTDSFSMIC